MIKKMLSNKTINQLFSYFFVGLGATLVEWIFFWVFDTKLQWHYSISTAAAFIFSTFANWLLGRLITFKGSKNPIVKELISVYLASIVGLLLNLVIMYVLIDIASLSSEMIAKIIATGIVFFYNFFIRKLFIYKK